MTLEATLAVLTFGVAGVPLAVHLARRRRRSAGLVCGAAWLLGTAALSLAARSYRPDAFATRLAERRPIQVPADGYVSSDTCMSCHPAEYRSWRDSYHRTMTQLAEPDAVVPDFEEFHFSLGEGEPAWALRRVGDAYWAATDDPSIARAPGEGAVIRRPLALVTGSHHQQIFWMLADRGRRLHLFPFVYRIREDRWAPYMSVVVAPGSVPSHPSEMWNLTCLRCHTTHPRTRDDGEQMDTRVGEFGIACESCHGPGREHVEANRSPLRRYARHVDRDDDGDPTIVHPARLTHERSSEACGLCHGLNLPKSGLEASAWMANGFRFRPGQDLSEYRRIVEYRDPDLARPPAGPLDESYWAHRYWEDGVLRIGGREYTAIRETACFQDGELSCLSCHELHRRVDDPRPPEVWADDMLLAGFEGRVGQASNVACLQCHEDLVGRETAHSRHREGSEGNSCYNCHMPHDTWGLLKATRNHRVSIPDVRADLTVGRPNACNLCHIDRTLDWTAGALEAAYDIPAPEIEDEERRRTSAIALYALRGDAGQRALAAWAMGWKPARDVAGTDWTLPLLAYLLEDPYGAVRTVASETLRTLPDPPAAEIEYFVGQQDGERLRPGLIDDWRARTPVATATTRPSVLLDARGDVREDRLRAILAQRDDRPIVLAE